MKIVGQMVLGPGEKYLDETLKEFQRLTDDVIICLNHAGTKEKRLVRKYDFRAYEDDREWGKHQPEIKGDLLERLRLFQADYILVLDADETIPTVKTRLEFENLTKSRRAMQFHVIDLWDNPEHFNPRLSFWNVRAYDPNVFTSNIFLRKPVHCGNAPPSYYALPASETYVPHILLHKGLMAKTDRERKYARYQQYDPKAIHKGREYYEELLAPNHGEAYNEAVALTQVNAFYAKLKP
jgi:hypothetical protein